MKTNPFARTILKIRVMLFGLAVVGMAGAGFTLGDSLAEKFGQATVMRSAVPQIPNASLAEALGAGRY